MAIPEKPITRKETFLAKAAGQDVSLPENTLTREEAYLRAIAENGGGGGTGDGDMKKSVYDKNNNGIVDNAEKVNNHTVEKDVPANAQFTDTVYDDTILSGRVTDLETEIIEKADKSELPTKTSDLTNDSNFVVDTHFEQTVTLSTSVETTVTFSDSAILATSLIDIAISEWGLIPSNVTVASGVCTVVMPKVTTAHSVVVRIYVR